MNNFRKLTLEFLWNAPREKPQIEIVDFQIFIHIDHPVKIEIYPPFAPNQTIAIFEIFTTGSNKQEP